MHLSFLISFRIPQIYCLAKGSNPEVGSSKNITFEFPTNDIARHNFLLPPPLKYMAN